MLYIYPIHLKHALPGRASPYCCPRSWQGAGPIRLAGERESVHSGIRRIAGRADLLAAGRPWRGEQVGAGLRCRDRPCVLTRELVEAGHGFFLADGAQRRDGWQVLAARPDSAFFPFVDRQGGGANQAPEILCR